MRKRRIILGATHLLAMALTLAGAVLYYNSAQLDYSTAVLSKETKQHETIQPEPKAEAREVVLSHTCDPQEVFSGVLRERGTAIRIDGRLSIVGLDVVKQAGAQILKLLLVRSDGRRDEVYISPGKETPVEVLGTQYLISVSDLNEDPGGLFDVNDSALVVVKMCRSCN